MEKMIWLLRALCCPLKRKPYREYREFVTYDFGLTWVPKDAAACDGVIK